MVLLLLYDKKIMLCIAFSIISNYIVLLCVGAETVRFKAEINFDGREVTRLYLSTLDLQKLLKVQEK